MQWKLIVDGGVFAGLMVTVWLLRRDLRRDQADLDKLIASSEQALEAISKLSQPPAPPTDPYKPSVN
jgi:hypothetical protein